MDDYDNYGAASVLNQFVDVLSNWYVRRSRDRFWSGNTEAPEKLDAYWTLFECLSATVKLAAPFVPFISDTIWQTIAGQTDNAKPSVHLCDYPTSDPSKTDPVLSERMKVLRDIASSGRSARADAKLKVRQPLTGVTVILSDDKHQTWLEQHDEILRTELNVRNVNYTADAAEYVTYQIVPNFKRLGPRVGKNMPLVKKLLGEADGSAVLAELNESGKYSLTVNDQPLALDSEDIEVRLVAKDGWAAAQCSSAVVVLATELTDELIRQGKANDVVRLVQDRRKEMDLEFTDRIELFLESDSGELTKAIDENKDYISQETLAVSLVCEAPTSECELVEKEVAGDSLKIYIRVAK